MAPPGPKFRKDVHGPLAKDWRNQEAVGLSQKVCKKIQVKIRKIRLVSKLKFKVTD